MTEFPKDDFYIKSGSSSNLVVDVERGFFVTWGAIKDGTKVVLQAQKIGTEHDAYQLWKFEDGRLVNKQTSLCLEADNGKPNTKLVLHAPKSPKQAANQRWTLTKDGYIALQSHPKYVVDVMKGSLKEGSYLALTDSSKGGFKANTANWDLVTLTKKRRSTGSIGVIKMEFVEAKGLKSVDSFLTGGKSDPYVRVFHEGDTEHVIAQTKVIEKNLNPVWNEVHYLPVKDIGDKFIFEVVDFNAFIKHKHLGQCTFEVTKELVKVVSDNVYEATPNVVDHWINLSVQGKLHYKAKFFPLNPLPEPSPDFLANLKEKPFDRSTLFTLITLQKPDGSFPPSDALANLFGYPNSDGLFNLYKTHCHDERILKINTTIWTTSMVIWFLRYLLKDFRSEWGAIQERAEHHYISKALDGDLEIEEIVIATGRKAVRDRFDIKVLDEKHIITRENVKPADVRRTIKYQLKNNGAFQVNSELAKSLSFANVEQLRTSLTVHINSQSKNTKITNFETQVWVTILVMYYFRLVCVDHRVEWEESYLKAYRWLWGQFKGREQIEQEAFKIVKSYVKERYTVKPDALELDDKFIKSISDKIDLIKKGNLLSREIVIDNVPAKKLYGVARINIIKAKNLMKSDSWFGGGASDPYVKITNVVNNLEYGHTRIVYNNINPAWNQVFYIPIYDLNDKFKFQIFDYNAFFKHTSLGFYILDLKDIVKVLGDGSVQGKELKLECSLGSSKGKLSFVADFRSFSEQELTTTKISKTTITIRHLYLLTTYHRQDGGFELTDKLAALLNFNSKEELITSFTTFVQNDEQVKALHVDIWATVLVTAFLKSLLWQHKHEWMTTYTKAENYLSETVTDIDTDERLYNLANKFVIERFNITEWESEDQKKSLGVIGMFMITLY
jgi:hypothetical protein